MLQLDSFTQSLAEQGFEYSLQREDGIPYLEIFHKDFRLMAIDVAMELARQLNTAVGVAGAARFATLEAYAIAFYIHTDQYVRSEEEMYGASVEAWLDGILGKLAPLVHA